MTTYVNRPPHNGNDDSQWSRPEFIVIEGRTETDIIDALQRQARWVQVVLVALFVTLFLVGWWYVGGPN